jgi:pimeloyl-ACP methyl ester carboxylesterase/predicted glycosyltransferase
MTDWQPSPEQSRAASPVRTGHATQNGVPIFYEVYGERAETILFVPPWAVFHSRMWKAQVGWFARDYRVVAFDPRGNGRSGRPAGEAAYSEREYAADMGAVLDATETRRAHLVTFSRGAQRCLLFAAENPQRVSSLVFMGPATALAAESGRLHAAREALMRQTGLPDEALPAVGYFNRDAWLRDPGNYRRFLVRFLESFFEPHSTKPIEDGLAWGLESDPATIAHTHLGWQPDGEEGRALCQRIQCPALVIHGVDDLIAPLAEGQALAEALGARLERVEGTGHGIAMRRPVQVNLALREFLDPGFERRPKRRARRGRGPRRVLYISSPIGLGHAQRDVAIAHELRALHPDVQIDWLAQHPVTRVLAEAGETIHDASRHLASESRHIESESAEHDLHCFQAIRRMDEILIHNFMVFHDVMRAGDYDLVIGDEAWEVDYYLHENPDEKRAPYVWLTDFVGFLPMEDGGAHEALLTADYNAEMIGHIARRPEVRDRAIFVGNPDDVVPLRFGPDLPWIREWTEANYAFSGYVTGFDPQDFGDRGALRAELGYAPDEKVCIVSVGGSGVGHHLLRRVIDAYPEAKRKEPALRMIVVAGPRIDPATLPRAEGLEVVSYVHNLYRHFAACDLAVVQGGLTTAMELTANKRPFLYFPLAHHFEQNLHVRHRLQNYRAGRCMSYATETRESIAQAIADELRARPAFRDVETDGARRAAQLIAEVL